MKSDVSSPRFTPGTALGVCRFVWEPLDHRSQGNKKPEPPPKPAMDLLSATERYLRLCRVGEPNSEAAEACRKDALAAFYRRRA